jgi:endonuclease/exonuclease/phosphatase family metal-dependent hydrolase
VVQAFVIELDGATLRLANTHLGAGVTDEERARQARRIVSLIRDLDLVAGDLNVQPDSGVLAEFRGLTDAWARAHPGSRSPHTNWEPGPRDHPPVQRLDYVLVSPSRVVRDVQIPTDWERWAPLSDHLPVVVDLEPPAPVLRTDRVIDLRD